MIVNCLIPARGGSKRIPRKNLIDFCGKPLMVWSIEQALVSKEIDKVYVSSEDAEILDCAVLNGAEIVLRPDKLTQDNSTLEDVIEHFLSEVPTDILVVLQPTSPLRLPGDINNCIKRNCMSVNYEDDLFLWRHIEPLTFNRNPRFLYDSYWQENGSIYVIKVSEFGKHGRYNLQPNFMPMHKWQSYEIDEPEDIRVCEALMKEFILKEEKDAAK
jgi:CMP-N-acetylneuraminic acid synthetase